MVCLWLLIGLGGIFGFIQLKNIYIGACKALASALATSLTSSGTYDWLWWLYWRFRHIIGFVSASSSSFDGACIVVRRGLAENGFFSFSFFLDLCAGHAKNQNNPSIVFFLQFNPSSLIYNFFFTLVVSN